MRVLVVGDVCLDVYWVGTIKGLAADAPVPVVTHSKTVVLPGMAGNVVSLLTQLGVEATLALPSPLHTSIKNRIVTPDGTQLIRWDVEDWCTPVSVECLQEAISTFVPDAIVVSDYAKGVVTPALIQDLLTRSAAGMPLFVDTKGDPFQWVGSNITLFPNQVEYTQWKSHYDWMESVVLKKSSEGAEVLRFGVSQASLGASCSAPKNTCGAGDAFLAGWVASTLLPSDHPHSPLVNALGVSGVYVSNPFDSRSVALTQTVTP